MNDDIRLEICTCEFYAYVRAAPPRSIFVGLCGAMMEPVNYRTVVPFNLHVSLWVLCSGCQVFSPNTVHSFAKSLLVNLTTLFVRMFLGIPYDIIFGSKNTFASLFATVLPAGLALFILVH